MYQFTVYPTMLETTTYLKDGAVRTDPVRSFDTNPQWNWFCTGSISSSSWLFQSEDRDATKDLYLPFRIHVAITQKTTIWISLQWKPQKLKGGEMYKTSSESAN